MVDNKLPIVRKAVELTINFPFNNQLEESEQNPIKKAIMEGGVVAPDGRCYMDNKHLPKLLVTDKKGAAKIINNAQENDKYANGNQEFLAISHIKRAIDERIQEPRSALEHEKLKHSENCLNAFRDASELVNERHIEADRIVRDRAILTQKKMREENITECELSGQPFTNDARGHHIKRVADNPREARDLDNIVVVKDKIHQDIHNEGAESPKELVDFIIKNEYNMPNNFK